jgi:hypothetical protein
VLLRGLGVALAHARHEFSVNAQHRQQLWSPSGSRPSVSLDIFL